MKKEIEIIEYDRKNGLQLKWDDDYTIKVTCDGREVLISANSEGLCSLARHLLTLAQKDVLPGCHIHLDEHNSLEEGAIDLVIEKI